MYEFIQSFTSSFKSILDENIRDNAIPISDCHSHLFKFFCLNENVEPLTAVKNFARDTTIGFTTDKEFKEVRFIC